MALPRDPEARNYYQCAKQWLDDANLILQKLDRTRAAVYLAGYGVECMLKALVLSTLPARKIAKLRRTKALFTHSLESLERLYLTNGGPPLRREIHADLLIVGEWDTELRYRPQAIKYKDAARFLEAAVRIVAWADGRL
jgi:hypothetical protein